MSRLVWASWTLACAMCAGVASAQETKTLPVGEPLPEKIGMVLGVEHQRGKGKHKEGSCEAALTEAQLELGNGGWGPPGAAVLLIPWDEGKVVDSATCELNKNGVATVQLSALRILHAPTQKVAELPMTRVFEMVAAVRASPTVGSSNMDGYHVQIREVDGKLFVTASSKDELAPFPVGADLSNVAVKSFHRVPISAHGALGAMRKLAEALPEIDGYRWEHVVRIRKPDNAGGGYKEHTIRFTFMREHLAGGPKAVLGAATAVVLGPQGAEKPLELNLGALPDGG